MLTIRSLSLLAAVLFSPLASSQNTASPKRGLVDITTKTPSDDSIWIRPGSDLTWYYNYGVSPSSAYSSDKSFEFVPMLWGAPSNPNSDDTSFLDTVQGLIKSGVNISYVLTYNEPDGSSSTGGSDIPTDNAASTWMRNIAPLRNMGVKVGLPAMTGAPSGFSWLANFNTSCQALNPNGCEADFIPVHWYGNFEGMASHIGQVRATYLELPIWVTEFADPDQPLSDSQQFYNQSTDYLDSLEYVDRYSFFGSTRSNVLNVGGNNAFLTQDGKLTDIGSWYLGGSATGNIPQGAAGRAELSWSLLLAVPLLLVSALV